MLGLEKLSGVEGADQHLSLIPALGSATTGPEPQTLTGTKEELKAKLRLCNTYMAGEHKSRLHLGSLKITDHCKQESISRGRTTSYLIFLLNCFK